MEDEEQDLVEEEENIEYEFSNIRNELLIHIRKYYNDGSDDELIKALGEFGRIGEELIRGIIIKGKDEEWAINKVNQLKEEDLF